MKVLLLSKYTARGASSRQRSLQFLPGMKRAGIKVDFCPLFDDRYLGSRFETGKGGLIDLVFAYARRIKACLTADGYDALWIEKELFPYLPAWFEDRLCPSGSPIVADYDDAIFHNYDQSGNPLIRAALGQKIDAVMRRSAVVVVGNKYLEQRALKAGAARVVVIPTVVDLTKYTRIGPIKESGRLVIGWIGTPITQRYLIQASEALDDAVSAINAELKLVGASNEIRRYFPKSNLIVEEWNANTENAHLRSFDIGIMPITDAPFERGKCGYKIVQYMASGVPVVASAVGVNVDLVTESGCGFLVDANASWRSAIKQLALDEHFRHEAGLRGRLAVEEKFCLQKQLPHMIALFKNL